MTRVALCFGPDGRGHCLYTEAIDLPSIGLLSIKRVSQVEFDQKRQEWTVCDLDGMELYSSASRSDCLDWERDYFA